MPRRKREPVITLAQVIETLGSDVQIAQKWCGVNYHRRKNMWESRTRFKAGYVHGGYYPSEVEAALVHDLCVLMYRKDIRAFRRYLNFNPPLPSVTNLTQFDLVAKHLQEMEEKYKRYQDQIGVLLLSNHILEIKDIAELILK